MKQHIYIKKEYLAFFLFITLFSFSYSQFENLSSSKEKNLPIADAHIHHGFSYQDDKLSFTNIEYFKDRGVNIINYPLPINRTKTENLVTVIEEEIVDLKSLSRSRNKFTLNNNQQILTDNLNNDKIKVLLSIEYFNGVFAGDPTSVEKFAKMHIRSITIVDNKIDRFFENDSLSDFGKKVISQMNEADILIDISHLSEKQMIEVINFSRSAVIASHSNVEQIADLNYNLSENVLKLLKDNAGYVFVSFNKKGVFAVEEPGKDGIRKFVDHIDHLKQTIGIDYIGIGSDYQASGKYVSQKLNQKNSYQQIIKELELRGYSQVEINKIMFGNYLRVTNPH